MGSRCLFVTRVSGFRRLPLPPARTTPFIIFFAPSLDRAFNVNHSPGDLDPCSIKDRRNHPDVPLTYIPSFDNLANSFFHSLRARVTPGFIYVPAVVPGVRHGVKKCRVRGLREVQMSPATQKEKENVCPIMELGMDALYRFTGLRVHALNATLWKV